MSDDQARLLWILQSKLDRFVEEAELLADMRPVLTSRKEFQRQAARTRRAALQVLRYMRHMEKRIREWKPEPLYRLDRITKSISSSSGPSSVQQPPTAPSSSSRTSSGQS